jgi:hypothetical protein
LANLAPRHVGTAAAQAPKIGAETGLAPGVAGKSLTLCRNGASV